MSKGGKLQRLQPSPNCKKCPVDRLTTPTVADLLCCKVNSCGFGLLNKPPTSLGKIVFPGLWGSVLILCGGLCVGRANAPFNFLKIAFRAMTFKSFEHAWNCLFNVGTCHYMPSHALRNLTEIVPDFNGWLSMSPGPNDLMPRRTLQTIAIDCHEGKFWIPPNFNG